MHAHQQSSDPVATIGLDIGKNTFHLVGLDERGAIVMRIKVSRNQLIRRLVNLPPCLVGLEAGSGSHHIARQLEPLGHDVRLIPAQYVKPFLKGHKNDYRGGPPQPCALCGPGSTRPPSVWPAPVHHCHAWNRGNRGHGSEAVRAGSGGLPLTLKRPSNAIRSKVKERKVVGTKNLPLECRRCAA
jgi:hypothetical protein